MPTTPPERYELVSCPQLDVPSGAHDADFDLDTSCSEVQETYSQALVKFSYYLELVLTYFQLCRGCTVLAVYRSTGTRR